MKFTGRLHLILIACAAIAASPCAWAQHTGPDFAANPTISSANDGAWSSPGTWSPSRVPNGDDVVAITHDVDYASTTGDARVVGIKNGGALRFSTTTPTRLRVGTLQIQTGGELQIGTSGSPGQPWVTAEVIIRDISIDQGSDPAQWGTGLLAYGGRVEMHGAVKSPTFVRAAAEPTAGQSVLEFAEPVDGWRVGDRVFLPDTRQVGDQDIFNANFRLHVEEQTIESIAANGRSITVSPGLSYDHRGARDADGTPTVLSNGTRLLPHIGNLSRNVIIRSENPSGTRGHTVFVHRTDVRISYVQFQDLGRTRAEPLDQRTNHIARYPLHMHHLIGPVNPNNRGYQYELIGNAVNDSLKWPITIHSTHFGLVRGNVVFGGSQLTGAGIALEDGSETENVIQGNFVANIRGNINPRESGPSAQDGTTPGSAGECIWGAGFNNRFIDNVVSTCRNPVQEIVSGPGFKFITDPSGERWRNPLVRGADMTDLNQTVEVMPQRQPLLEFRGNEVYGVAADGFTAWQLGTDGYDLPSGIQESVIRDFRVWHTYEGAIYNYPAHRMKVEDLVFRVDPNVGFPSAFQCMDYRNKDITFVGGSIHAGSIAGLCLDPLGTMRFQDIEATTRYHAFRFETPSTFGTLASRPSEGVEFLLRNNRISPWPGQPLRTINMDFRTDRGNSHPSQPFEVHVEGYQGRANDDFRVYFAEQVSQDIAGGRAPCNDSSSRPEVSGVTCMASGDAPPPVAPKPEAPTALTAQ